MSRYPSFDALDVRRLSDAVVRERALAAQELAAAEERAAAERAAQAVRDARARAEQMEREAAARAGAIEAARRQEAEDALLARALAEEDNAAAAAEEAAAVARRAAAAEADALAHAIAAEELAEARRARAALELDDAQLASALASMDGFGAGARAGALVTRGVCGACGVAELSAAAPGVEICNGPAPHALCLECATNMVRSQIENGTDSIRCAICPPAAAIAAAAAVGGMGLPRYCTATGTSIGIVLFDSFEVLRSLTPAAQAAGAGGAGGELGFRPLSDDEARRFRNLMVANAARRAGDDVRVCPRGECLAPVWIEAGGGAAGGAAADVGAPVRCGACRYELCGGCGEAWVAEHAGKSCAAYRRELAAAAETAALLSGIGTGVGKHCPACNTLVLHARGHGCHHIAPAGKTGARGGCPSCHTHWCYVCRTVFPGTSWVTHACPMFCSATCGCIACPDCRPQRPCPNA